MGWRRQFDDETADGKRFTGELPGTVE